MITGGARNKLLGKSDNPEQTYIQEVMPSKLALNLAYVKSHNLRTDLSIIRKTVWKIFKKRKS